MANPQIENGFIKIANELWDEILRRNFTKRQQNLVLFIWRLSYGTGQKDCVVERFNDFELAGLYKQDIKKELNYLRNCNVLDWDEETMVFSINKNYNLWQISPNKNWDYEKFKGLIYHNIQRKKVSKTRTAKKNEVSNLLTYRFEIVSKSLTMRFVNYLPSSDKTSITTRDPSSLKTLLKTLIIKDSITTTNKERKQKTINPESEKEIKTSTAILNRYMELRGLMTFSPKDEMAAKEIEKEGIPLDDAIKYLEDCFVDFEKRKKHSRDRINGLQYCVGYIFDRYHKQKGRANNVTWIYGNRSSDTRDFKKGTSYEQALREAELARRAFNR